MKKEKAPFQAGDLVTTSFYGEETLLVCRVIECEKGETGSGWRVFVGDMICPICGRSNSLPGLDAFWYKKYSWNKVKDLKTGDIFKFFEDKENIYYMLIAIDKLLYVLNLSSGVAADATEFMDFKIVKENRRWQI